jgi:hypothetical protein
MATIKKTGRSIQPMAGLNSMNPLVIATRSSVFVSSAETQQSLEVNAAKISAAVADQKPLVIEVPPIDIPVLNKVEERFRNQFRAEKAVKSQA